jgi:D-alanine-D-alanine ligase
MKVLVLHSDIPPDAPPEDQDTLIAARAVSEALGSRGHEAPLAAFTTGREALQALLDRHRADVVFNLVEGIEGKGRLAYIAPQMLDELGVRYTGAGAEALIVTGDKPRTKRLLRNAEIPTPAWAEPPAWKGLAADHPGGRWIVKCADEDASVGLDDGAVVDAAGVPARAEACAARYGGAWFAEQYIDGREFNIAIIERNGIPHLLPMAEMTFAKWPADRPRIVSYTAKWDDASFDSVQTVRQFGVEASEPQLAHQLRSFCEQTWSLFGCRGTARVDFRVDGEGQPFILEINPNPGIAPDAGMAIAAAEAGLSYADLIEGVVKEALR